MTEQPRFRPAAIEMLRRVGGDGLASKMAEMFREGAPRKIAAARAALSDLDEAAFARAAHSLKSSAGQIGAARLEEICADIETNVPTDKARDSIVRMLDVAEAEIDAAAAWLGSALRKPESHAMTRIAVVEDNPDNMLLVRLILENQYEVDEYSTGAAALEGMKAQVPAVVLLDISLPEMDGVEVLSHMKKTSGLRCVPVIALTAHAGRTDRERFISAGFDDYVTKPIVDENELLSAISRLVAKAHAG